jgi:glycine/serine hydroxymethyltransferase
MHVIAARQSVLKRLWNRSLRCTLRMFVKNASALAKGLMDRASTFSQEERTPTYLVDLRKWNYRKRL